MKKPKVYAAGEKIIELYCSDCKSLKAHECRNGAVKISYDDANHSYVKALRFPDGSYTDYQPTHGITAPLKLIPKEFLMPWAAKLTAYAALEWAVRNFDPDGKTGEEVLTMLDDVGKDKDKKDRWAFTKRYGKWLSPIKSAYRKKSQEGKDAGTWLHSAIEEFYNSGRKITPIVGADSLEGKMWHSFHEFDNFWKPDVEETEFFVYSMAYGYSGQGDMKGVMSGKKVILDWKTTSRSEFSPEGITVDNFFQLGGLSQAEYERTGRWPDDIGIVNFDKEGAGPIVVMGSEFRMSPMDAAKAYIATHNNYHMLMDWEYKFGRRS